MSEGGLMFCDIIWYFVGDFGNTEKFISFICMVVIMLNYCGVEIMFYIICSN